MKSEPPCIPSVGSNSGVVKRILISLAVVLAVAMSVMPVVIRAYVLQPFKIPTGSMQPTLMGVRQNAVGQRISGDRIFVEKLSYRFHPPCRGDIIVFRTDSIPALPTPMRGHYYVRRVVGLPGERVSIQPPYVLINGEKLLEPAIFKRIADGVDGFSGYSLARSFPSLLSKPSDELHIPAGGYFVLGDNSDYSLDSRYWGTVPVGDIIGRVISIYWPVQRIGTPN
jgi:signal peptidase I